VKPPAGILKRLAAIEARLGAGRSRPDLFEAVAAMIVTPEDLAILEQVARERDAADRAKSHRRIVPTRRP
jgi:hypothetical protein